MYLKKVYRHSKFMFAGILFFMAIQLVINFKKGMVFTPFFHYGMYSGKQKPLPFYKVNIVMVNGDTLRGSSFSPAEWDKIHYTLKMVLASYCDPIFYKNQVARLFKKANLPIPPAALFINKGTSRDKVADYKFWLANQLGQKGASIEIVQNDYLYQSNRFVYQKNVGFPTGTNHLCR